ncbi:hypothetical protein DTO021C3_7300 [Paecilomyces variotii]|nr:hypothetical protein DTO021C3_7300 [Paecilomyces variotii]
MRLCVLLADIAFLISLLAIPLNAGLALLPRNDTANEIITAIEDAVDCTACESLLVLLQGLAHLGNDAFVGAITDVCVGLQLEDSDVCSGAISREGPILAHDLRSLTVGTKTAQLFCSTVFGLCDYPEVTEYQVPFPVENSTVVRPSVSGETPLQIVQISDIHVDRFYETGANWNCTKNICCRSYTAADAPGNTSYPPGPYGNHECDSPPSLEESLYNAITDIVPDAAFTLFTGDVVEGAVWMTTETEVTNDLNNAYSKMQSMLRNQSVYGAVGNHDSNPVNSFPPSAVSTTMSSQWVYDTLSNLWSTWIGSTEAARADTNSGAYSVRYPNGNLRIISINTNMYYKENFWLYEATMERDPSGQLAWLVGELQAAEDAGERVYIIGHMPMGSGDALHDGSNYFNQIVNRYQATIAAQFYGHTHKDEFEIAYSNYSSRTAENAVAMSYVAPALTPTSGNPAFRVFTVDPVTFGILDMTTYITNMSTSTYQTDGPVWEKYYSVKEAYGPLVTLPLTDPSAELTPAFWHNVTEVLASNSSTFDEYWARKWRGYDVDSCTGSCVTDEICQLRAAEARYNCITVTPGVSFKRDLHQHSLTEDGHDHCEGSLAKGIFQKLARTEGAMEKIRQRA